MRKQFAYGKTKVQISFAVTAKLISIFVFATQIVKFLYFLNPKFPASSHLLCLYNLVCFGPFQMVFSLHGSIKDNFAYFCIKTHVVGTHWNCLGKAVLMRTHNKGLNYQRDTNLANS